MKFGIFYEHQLPRPWNEGDELKLFQDALVGHARRDEILEGFHALADPVPAEARP